MTASDSGRSADQGAGSGRNGSAKPGLDGGKQEHAARMVVGYPISGMVAYGGIGWLIGRLTHIALLFPVGLFVGLVVGAGLMIYRVRSQ